MTSILAYVVLLDVDLYSLTNLCINDGEFEFKEGKI